MNRWTPVAMGALLSIAGCSSMNLPFDVPADLGTSDSVDATMDVGADTADVQQRVDVPMDTRVAIDAGMDARSDVPEDVARDTPMDAPMDSPIDVRTDTSTDAMTDTVIIDASDGSRDVAPTTDAAASRTLACAPVVPSSATSGISCDSRFWSGFRFEITGSSPVTVTEIGLQASLNVGSTGSVHATLVRLTGPSDAPDQPDLTGTDVVLHALVDFPTAGTSVQRVAVDATVMPGWYAVVFGTGAFGATATSATLPSAGATGCTLPGSSFPFSIRQSDGTFVLQASTPHMFVTVTP